MSLGLLDFLNIYKSWIVWVFLNVKYIIFIKIFKNIIEDEYSVFVN